jgi:hypothetical protein
MSDFDDDNDDVGYGRPPKRTRFKKGQSGCPDGGWKTKRAKTDQEKEEEKPNPSQQIFDWYTKKRRVRVGGVTTEMTAIELMLHQLEEEAFVKKDPEARKLLLGMLKPMGLLKAPPQRQPGTGVLVVYPMAEQTDWIARTEGELLPKDPLHGTSYAGGSLAKKKFRRGPPDGEI